jgi:hypothetical protein
MALLPPRVPDGGVGVAGAVLSEGALLDALVVSCAARNVRRAEDGSLFSELLAHDGTPLGVWGRADALEMVAHACHRERAPELYAAALAGSGGFQATLNRMAGALALLRSDAIAPTAPAVVGGVLVAYLGRRDTGAHAGVHCETTGSFFPPRSELLPRGALHTRVVDGPFCCFHAH